MMALKKTLILLCFFCMANKEGVEKYAVDLNKKNYQLTSLIFGFKEIGFSNLSIISFGQT